MHKNRRLASVRVCNSNRRPQSGQNFPPVLKIELWSRACLATLTFYTACTVRVTIFSTGGKFRPVARFLRSYTLLFQSPVLMRSWCTKCIPANSRAHQLVCSHAWHTLVVIGPPAWGERGEGVHRNHYPPSPLAWTKSENCCWEQEVQRRQQAWACSTLLQHSLWSTLEHACVCCNEIRSNTCIC